MRIFILTILLIIEIIIESTILSFINIRGTTPNLVLMTVISMGLIYGKKEGLTLGLIGGLLFDILFGRIIGIHGIVYMMIGYLMGVASERVYMENRIIPFFFTIVGTMFLHGSFYFSQYLRGVEFSMMHYFENFTSIAIIINSVIILFIYPLFLRFSKWSVLKEK